tara:strand:+ start:209 stop:811 length:603 start_codon:yes stop_codon:yes gene_type:complete
MMRKRIRVLLLVSIFVSIGGLLYQVIHNLWDQKVKEIEENPLKVLDFVPEASLRLKDFRRSKVRDGRTMWEVIGEEAAYIKEKKEAVIKNPRLVFYDKKGEAMEVLGNEGRLFMTDREMDKMQLLGGVEVNYQGFVMRTDEILYHQDEDHVISLGRVTIHGDGLEVEGMGMNISLLEEKIRLKGGVKTKIQMDQLKNNRS